MERAGATPLSFGPPAEGGPPAHMDLSLAKRPRPPSEAEQDPDSENEDQQTDTDTDAIYEMSFSQAGDLVLLDTTVYAAIVELLLELEGVDPEPDFWARSSRGPWHIAVNEDCMQQYQARYGLQTTIRVHQVAKSKSSPSRTNSIGRAPRQGRRCTRPFKM